MSDAAPKTPVRDELDEIVDANFEAMERSFGLSRFRSGDLWSALNHKLRLVCFGHGMSEREASFAVREVRALILRAAESARESKGGLIV